MLKSENEKNQKARRIITLAVAAIMLSFCILLFFEAFRTYGGYNDFKYIVSGGEVVMRPEKVFGEHYYKVLLSCGVLLTIASSVLRRKTENYPLWFAIVLPIYFFAESLGGAKILYAFENAVSEGSFKNLSFSGQSLFGSLYFLIPMIALFGVIFRKKIRPLLDYVAYFWFILLPTTRIGCILSGCCGAKKLYLGDCPIVLPVQLFDAISALIMLYICQKMSQKEKTFLNFRPITVLLIGYSFCRFLFEFIRTNEVLFLKLTMSQYHCILFMIIGVVVLIYDNRQLKKQQ